MCTLDGMLRRRHISYAEARPQVADGDLSLWRARLQVADGDLLLWRARGPASLVIAGGDRSEYSHVGRISRGSDGEFYSLDFSQWHGPVGRKLIECVERYPGRIDVYRANTERFPEYRPQMAVAEMSALMMEFHGRYGWRNIGRVAVAYSPFGRMLWRWWVAMLAENGSLAPHCSDATSRCDIAAGVDPVPNTPSWGTTPGDFGRSLLYEYQYTLGGAV